MIAIIDYHMSNLFSVRNALEYLGIDSEITSNVTKIMTAKGAILPGVGAFAEAMKHLKSLDLIQPIKDFVDSGKPFMGICLGLQLLLSESEEFGYTDGLGIVEGKVEKFENHENIRIVPHVGWNSIKKKNKMKRDISIDPLSEVESGEYFYFVHSYYVKPDNEGDICTTTRYSSLEFCSSILMDNLFASQFHPEKSGEIGLKILNDFFQKREYKER